MKRLSLVQADRLYFLKRHTLIEEMNFNPENETYIITGYKNDKRKYMKMSDITSMVKDVEDVGTIF